MLVSHDYPYLPIKVTIRGGVEIVGLGVAYMARVTLLGNECLMGQGILKRLRVTFDHGTQIIVEP